MSRLKIGVLALQGAVIEHINILKKFGAESVQVKDKKDFKGLDGLILPGGESTTMSKLIRIFGLEDELKKICRTRPILATCAGIILLSKDIINDRQFKLNLLDVTVLRNGYGHQVESFETKMNIPVIGKKKIDCVFIRAPIIEKQGKNVEIFAEFKNKLIFGKQDNILFTTFHPELSSDKRIHEYFLSMVKNDSIKKSV